jgi:hypothetical protein
MSRCSAPLFRSCPALQSGSPQGFVEFCSADNNPKPNTCAIRLSAALHQTDDTFFEGTTFPPGHAWKPIGADRELATRVTSSARSTTAQSFHDERFFPRNGRKSFSSRRLRAAIDDNGPECCGRRSTGNRNYPRSAVRIQTNGAEYKVSRRARIARFAISSNSASWAPGFLRRSVSS